MTKQHSQLLRTVLFLVPAALCIRAFYDVAQRYGDFHLTYGWGISKIPPTELVFYIWYLLFGGIACFFLTAAVAGTAVASRIEALVRAVLARERAFLLLATSFLLAATLAFRFLVLLDSPIADDESTYAFIAQTLLQGRVINPLPEDPDFFRNQFVVMNEAGWFGKYPIGHPLMLALGEALGLRFIVVPLITCAALILTYAIGRAIFSRLEAGIAVCLLLLSPHFVFTGATQLSQPTSMLCMLGGLLAMQALLQKDSAAQAALAGAAFGFGILVRPLPGAFFLLAAAIVYVVKTAGIEWRTRWKHKAAVVAAGAVPVLLAGVVLLWVNQQQSGEALRSGYHAEPGGLQFRLSWGRSTGLSIAGALLRQNFWLFGWPFSLLFVFFARGKAGLALFWSLIAAEYTYRYAVPKTVVATTGPIYVTEIVPLLALATASGMVNLKQWLRSRGFERARIWVVSTAVSATLVMAIMFLPVQVSSIHRTGVSWQLPYRMLEEHSAGTALVFSDAINPPEVETSWAYYPPNPSPALDDDVIFVRPLGGKEGAIRMLEFWRRRFPDRTAWVFGYMDNTAVLAPLHGNGSE